MESPGNTENTTLGGNLSSQGLMKAAQVLGYYGARKQRTSLSVQTKLEVIRYAEQNPSITQNKIASHFGIDRTTVSKVLKRKELFKTTKDGNIKSASNSAQFKFYNSDYKVEPSSSSVAPVKEQLGKWNTVLCQGSAFRVKQTANEQQRDKDLYEKCESWFMKQKFTTASKRHQKDIIAYSCLISPLPLTIEECNRIIPAKVIKDEGVKWLYEQIRSSDTSHLGMSAFKGRGEELFSKYIREQGPVLNEKLKSLFKSYEYTAGAIRHIWKKYVGPIFLLFASDLSSDDEDYSPILSPPKPITLSVISDPKEPISVSPLTSQQPLERSETPLLVSAKPTVPSEKLSAPVLSVNGNENSALDLSTQHMEKVQNGSVRGSRKRKMNSNPTRLITPQSDENEDHSENGHLDEIGKNILVSDTDHELVNCVEFSSFPSQIWQNHPKTAITAIHNAPLKRVSRNAVIEIIPDSCRSASPSFQENTEYRPKHPHVTMPVCTSSEPVKAADNNCDNTESLHDLSNGKCLSAQTMKGILRNMSLIAKEVKNLKGQVGNSKPQTKQMATEKLECSCGCNANLHERVSGMERKLESMQQKIDELCEIVTIKQ